MVLQGFFQQCEYCEVRNVIIEFSTSRHHSCQKGLPNHVVNVSADFGYENFDTFLLAFTDLHEKYLESDDPV